MRDPEGRVFASLADALRRAGRLDEALTCVDRGLEEVPEFASAHLVRGRIADDLGDLETARSAYERVLQLDAHNRFAAAALLRIDEREANRTLPVEHPGESPSESVAPELTSPVSTPPEPTRAEPTAAELTGAEPTGAVDAPRPLNAAELEASGAADPDRLERAEAASSAARLPLATRTLGETYARQGLYEQALEVLEQVLQGAPDDDDLRARVEELRVQTGAAPAARETGAGTAKTFEASDAPSVREYFGRLQSFTPSDRPEGEA
jgi:tetratricopeptide (TPR) repeat protein